MRRDHRKKFINKFHGQINKKKSQELIETGRFRNLKPYK